MVLQKTHNTMRLSGISHVGEIIGQVLMLQI